MSALLELELLSPGATLLDKRTGHLYVKMEQNADFNISDINLFRLKTGEIVGPFEVLPADAGSLLDIFRIGDGNNEFRGTETRSAAPRYLASA